MLQISEFYYCCGAKIVHGFPTIVKYVEDDPKHYSYKHQEDIKKQLKEFFSSQPFINVKSYYGHLFAILNDSQLYFNEQLLLENGFQKISKGLNGVHNGSVNTIFLWANTKAFGKEIDREGLPIRFEPYVAPVPEPVKTPPPVQPAQFAPVGFNNVPGAVNYYDPPRNQYGQFVPRGAPPRPHNNDGWVVGARVRCVNAVMYPNNPNGLINGNVYEITEPPRDNAPEAIIFVRGLVGGFYRRRFELVRE